MTLYKSKILNVTYVDDPRCPDTVVTALQSSPQPQEDVLDIVSDGYNFIGITNELDGTDASILHDARRHTLNGRGRVAQRFVQRNREVYIDRKTGIEGVNDPYQRAAFGRSKLLG